MTLLDRLRETDDRLVPKWAAALRAGLDERRRRAALDRLDARLPASVRPWVALAAAVVVLAGGVGVAVERAAGPAAGSGVRR